MGKIQFTTGPKDYNNSSASPTPGPEIDQSTKKAPFYKKKAFIGAVAAVVLVGVAASGGDNDVSPDRMSTDMPPADSSIITQVDLTPESNSASKSDPTPDPEPEPADKHIKSGSYTLPCGAKLNFSDSVRNDTTGKWRLASTSDSLVPADYAAEYYDAMFSSDDEIHGIWNATLKTTTRISVFGNLLLVDTMEYVDKEEHDANLLFSGMLLDSRIVNIETGEVAKALGVDVKTDEETTPENASGSSSEPQSTPVPPSETGTVIPLPDESSSTAETQPEPEPAPSTPEPVKQTPASPPISNGGSGNANNFDTYDNAAQQKTSANYVLNTNTMKFHHPGCSQVKKIAPQNYQEFYGARSDAIAIGYSPCGRCHP